MEVAATSKSYPAKSLGTVRNLKYPHSIGVIGIVIVYNGCYFKYPHFLFPIYNSFVDQAIIHNIFSTLYDNYELQKFLARSPL